MGGCVSSVQKNPESSFKFRFPFGSKNDELVMPSPLKEKPLVNNDGDPTISPAGGLKSQWPPSEPVTTARRFESKEETFFDSQAWLESDCDDDFVSVNGDFTPSRGSTPVHHNFSAGTQPGSRQLLDDKTSAEPSPTGKKKRLSDLFEESLRSDQVLAYNNHQIGKNETETTVIGLPPKSAENTPFASVAHSSACSSEQTPPGNYRSSEQEKSVKSVQCCLPRMLSSRSLKKIDSPAHSVRVV